jgi:hypothetical protein
MILLPKFNLHNIFLFLSIHFLTAFVAHAQDQKAAYAKWAGTYHSTLPCLDCDSIHYVLRLYKDRRFEEELIYKGKSDTVVTHKGNYNIPANGIMHLVRKRKGFKYFRKHPEGLRLLDTNARIVHDETAFRFILKTAKRYTTPNFVKHKYSEGTNFYAFGNNDKWTIDIEFGKIFTYITDTDSITSRVSKADTSADKKTIILVAKNDSIEFRINIQRDSCRNPLTGERFAAKVFVQLIKKGATEIKELTGGGRMLPNYHLSGIWIATKLYKKRIKPEYHVPKIEFNTVTEKIKGYSSCNHFEGHLLTESENLKCVFSPTTIQACPDVKYEADLYRILSSNNLTYRFEGTTLKIFEGEIQALELRNIEK